MVDDDDPALRRILRQVDGTPLVDALSEKLSGADLTTLLLEVFRRRADQLTPAEVMRRYRRDRFVAPSSSDALALRRAEDALISALPDGFELLTLAPLVPLAAHSAVATVDPRKVIATVRGTEVAADPTNGLALEAAHRRSAALALDRRSAEVVRLAASQRVTRAQFSGRPEMLAHFLLFALVSAGCDTGDRAFEREQVIEHLRYCADAVRTTVRGAAVQLRLTVLRPEFGPVADDVREQLSGRPGLEVVDDPARDSGRGYYTGLCYKVHAAVGGDDVEVGDGGFVDWSQHLVGSRKERLLITGLGVDRLAQA